MLSQAQQTELTRTMAKSVESAFKQVSDGMLAQMRQQTANDNQPPSARRDVGNKKGASATAGMEANRRLTSSINNLNKHVGAAADIFGDLNKTAKGYHSELERTMRLYGQVQDQMAVTFRAHRKMRDVIGKDVKTITERMKMEEDRVKAEKEYTDHLKEMKKAAKDFVDEVRSSSNNSPGGSGNNNNNNNRPGGGSNNDNRSPFDKMDVIGDAVSAVSSKLLGLASITKGVTATFDDFQYALKTSSQFTMSTIADSIQMGMSARALMEMQSEFRVDAMKTAGGLQAWTNNLKASQLDLIAHTGSLQEANKVNAQLRNTYMKLGLTLEDVTDALGTTQKGMLSDFAKLKTVTGKTMSEIAGIVEKVNGTDENRELLLKMTATQRKDFIKSQTALMSKYTILTGSIERAQAMVEQQNRNRNKTAIDRFKDGIRIKAVGGQLGLDMDALDRFAQLNARAPGSLNDEEKNEMANIRGDLARKLNELRSSDDLSKQIYGDKIIEKFNLEDIMVFDKGLDRKMNDAAIVQQQANNMSSIIDGTPYAKESLAFLSSIDSVLKQSLTPLAAAALVYFGQKLMVRGDFFDAFGRRSRSDDQSNNNSDGKSKGRKRTRRQRLMDMQARKGGWGKLGKFAAKGGAPTAIIATVASMGLDAAWQPDTSDGTKAKEFTMDAIDTASAAAMGATIGSFIAPGVGTAIGAALGGAIGATYALTNDDYFKTANELRGKEHADAMQIHNMQRKMLVAEWENRQSSFLAFQRSAGPEFTSNMRKLVDKHNANLDESQHIQLDQFSKFTDLKSVLQDTLTDTELQLMQKLYEDETENMATRHRKQLEHLDAIHQLNVEQSGAYEKLMKLDQTAEALSDFSVGGAFDVGNDNVDTETLNAALGTADVQSSLVKLQDAVKNSGMFSEQEIQSMTPDQWAKLGADLSDGKFELASNNLNDDARRVVSTLLTELQGSVKRYTGQVDMRGNPMYEYSQGKINEYIKGTQETARTRLESSINDTQKKIEHQESSVIKGDRYLSDDNINREDLAKYLSNREDLDVTKLGYSGVDDLISYMEAGNQITDGTLVSVLKDYAKVDTLDATQNKSTLPDPAADETLQSATISNLVVSDITPTPITIEEPTKPTLPSIEEVVPTSVRPTSVMQSEVSPNKPMIYDFKKLSKENLDRELGITTQPTNVKTEVEAVSNNAPTSIVEQPTNDVKPTAPVAIETQTPVGSDISAKAANVGTAETSGYQKFLDMQADHKKRKDESADAAVADGKVTLEEVVAQLKLIYEHNQMTAQKKIDMYKSAQTDEQRRHLEKAIFGEKRMQDMKAGKAGS